MIAVGIRMLLPCLITGAFAFTTTSPGEFTAALRRMHVPEAVIIPCIVVIRFFPTLREDYRHIRNAMALRGIPSGGGSPLRHPAQSLEYIIVPLLMNATVVAQDLSVAAMTKGLGNPGRHTSMTDIRIGIPDWAIMILCALPAHPLPDRSAMSNTPESRIGAGRIVIDAEHIGFRYRTGLSADVATRERDADGTPSAPHNGMSADISPRTGRRYAHDSPWRIRGALRPERLRQEPRSPGCSTD